MHQCNAILILGGGLQPNGEPLPWVVERLRAAAAVEGQPALVCLSGFTPHKAPPVDEAGFPIGESQASAAWLLGQGVPAARIYTESCSWDTIGNAFFARVLHTELRGWRRLLVVTSETHMPRTRAIFEHVFLLPPASTPPVSMPQVSLASGPESAETTASPLPYELEFLATADVGFTAEQLADRRAAEAEGLRKWLDLNVRQPFHNLAELHQWLYSQHDAYAAGRHSQAKAGAVTSTY